VVLFDDGLGRIDVAALAAALNQRPGWKAEVLEGGFSAWSALPGAAQTSPAGLHKEDLQQITYDDLAALKENVVLVDLRPIDPAATGAKAKAATGKRSAAAGAPDPVTGFCGEAANRSYLHSLGEFRQRFKPAPRPQAETGRRAAATAAPPPPLIVLVDAVGADHRETVRRLRAEGYSRILVLAGGDEAILLQGRRGKGRISGAIGEGTLSEPSGQPQPAQP
jgi:rhodanese-related sulfurtransferase